MDLYDIGCTLSRFGLAGIGICTGRAICVPNQNDRWCASNKRIDFFLPSFSFIFSCQMGIRIWGLERTIIGPGTFFLFLRKRGCRSGEIQKKKSKEEREKAENGKWDLGGLWAYMGIGVGHSSFALQLFLSLPLYSFLLSLFRLPVLIWGCLDLYQKGY